MKGSGGTAVKFYDVTSILNFGLESQNRIAELNQMTTRIIRGSDYTEFLRCLEELSSIAAQGEEDLIRKEERLDALQETMSKKRIEILKEGQLLKELRKTNDIYAERLAEEIRYAEGWLKAGSTGGSEVDIRERLHAMDKRVVELRTTKTVADNFSAQISLSETNCIAMADRIWKVMVDIMPLLRGRISAKINRDSLSEAKKLLGEHEKELEKLVK